MHLVVHQVVELEEVDPAHGHVVLEQFAGAAVAQLALAVLAQVGQAQGLVDRGLVGAVEDGGGHLPAQGLGRVAQVDLQHLTDVHTAGHAQGVQHDVQRRAVGQIGHVLLGQDAADHALVAVAAGHLVAHGDLALLGDVDPDHFVDAGAHLVARLAGEALHVHDDARLAVGHFKAGVPDLPGLFAEDGPQQALLRGQVGLALGGNLAHQDVTRVDLRAHHDDAALVQIFQRVLAHAGDVPGDLLGSQLGVTGVAFVFLHMDGGEHVLHHQTLVQENGVLVVVALPGHEAHQDVLAQAQLALGGAGAVGQDRGVLGLALLVHPEAVNPLAHLHDGTLVEAGALVAAGELDELIVFDFAGVVVDADARGADPGDSAVPLGQQADAGVDGALVLDAGGHDGGLGGHQGHGLALHVGAHQGAVGVVVLQEGDHGRGDGDHHAGAHVDEVHPVLIDLDDLVPVAADDALVDEAAILIHRLRGLADDVVVLHVGGHILHVVRQAVADDPAALVPEVLDAAVGGDEEAVLVDPGEGGQIADEADVGAFRRLDGAHTAIVAVVYVAHVEAGALAAQAAGAQGGDAALVGQLGQGVGLVHELAQGGGTEELLDGRRHRADVHQTLWSHNVQVLEGHALADDPLHAGEADAELVLQQLAHGAHPAVAQVVDVVRLADAAGQAVQVVDGGKDVVQNDVLGQQQVHLIQDLLAQLVPGILLGQATQQDAAHLLLDAQVGGVQVDAHLPEEFAHVDHAVGEDADGLALHVQVHLRHAGVLERVGPGAGQGLPRLGQQLAGVRVGHRLGQGVAADAGGQGQLFIKLVAAHVGDVVAAVVVEQAVQQGLGAVHRGGIAGAQTLVDLDQALLPAGAGVLLEGGRQAQILAEDAADHLVGDAAGHRGAAGQAAQPGAGLVFLIAAHGFQQPGHGDLAVFVDADIEHVVHVSLELQPGPVVGDDGGGVDAHHGLVRGLVEIDAGGADDLGDDDALGPVDDEGAPRRHDGEVAHEDLLLLDLLGLPVAQPDADLQRGGVGGVPRLALLLGIFGFFVDGIAHEAQFQVSGIVRDGIHLVKDLPKPLLQEPVIGIPLDLQQVRHFLDLRHTGKALAQRLAVHYVLRHVG